MGVLKVAGVFAAALIVFGLLKLSKFLYDNVFNTSLRDFPGPPSSSLIYGNFKEIWEAENSVLHEKWVEKYGTTIAYSGLLGMKHLYTTDTKALNHVLMNSYDYQKPEALRFCLNRFFVTGILAVEEDKHKQQRKIMNPAFGAAQIRELTKIFVEKSIQLRDIWAGQIAVQEPSKSIDVLHWLSKMALDVIGLAGFNYKFDTLTSKNELNDAYSVVTRSGTKISLLGFLMSVPGSRFLLKYTSGERDVETKQAKETVYRICNQILRDSKAAIANTSEKIEKNSSFTRDLLSLLLRANMSIDLPQNQRMSDKDAIAQIPTFLGAGHETTSTSTTWALFALTQNPEAQVKLRDELLTVSTDNPTMDELNALPYLDAVVRETLRVHAPIITTIRVAMKDDVLPLNTPFRDKKGNVHHVIKKGQLIFIPILAINRAKSIWGEDASEFKPERWEYVPEAASTIPGIWGNMMTFLGGPRACIGYRFSLVEMKALLFTLVRAFEFELAVPPKDLIKKSGIAQRPVVATEPDKTQLPLLIKPYLS